MKKYPCRLTSPILHFDVELHDKPCQVVVKIVYEKLVTTFLKRLINDFPSSLRSCLEETITRTIVAKDNTVTLSFIHPWDQIKIIERLNLHDSGKTCSTDHRSAFEFQKRLTSQGNALKKKYNRCPGMKPKTFYNVCDPTLFKFKGINQVDLFEKSMTKKKYKNVVVLKKFCDGSNDIRAFIIGLMIEIFQLISGQLSPSIRIVHDDKAQISIASTYIDDIQIQPRLSQDIILDVNFIRGITALFILKEEDHHKRNVAIVRDKEKNLRLLHFDIDRLFYMICKYSIRLGETVTEDMKIELEDMQTFPGIQKYNPHHGVHRQLQKTQLLEISSNWQCIKAKYKTIFMFIFLSTETITNLSKKYNPFQELTTQVVNYLDKERKHIFLLLKKDMLFMKVMSEDGDEIIKEMMLEYTEFNKKNNAIGNLDEISEQLNNWKKYTVEEYKKYCEALRKLQLYLVMQLNLSVKRPLTSEPYPFEHLEIDFNQNAIVLLNVLTEKKIIRVNVNARDKKYYIYYIDHQALQTFILESENNQAVNFEKIFPFNTTVQERINQKNNSKFLILSFDKDIQKTLNLKGYIEYLNFLGVIPVCTIENNQLLIKRFNTTHLIHLAKNPGIYLQRLFENYFLVFSSTLKVSIMPNSDISLLFFKNEEQEESEGENKDEKDFSEWISLGIIKEYSKNNSFYILKGVNYKLLVKKLSHDISLIIKHYICSHKELSALDNDQISDFYHYIYLPEKRYIKLLNFIISYICSKNTCLDLSSITNKLIQTFQDLDIEMLKLFDVRNIQLAKLKVDEYILILDEKNDYDVLNFLRWWDDLGWCEYDERTKHLKIVNVEALLTYLQNHQIPVDSLKEFHPNINLSECDHFKLFKLLEDAMRSFIIYDFNRFLRANYLDENEIGLIKLTYTKKFKYGIFITSNPKNRFDVIEAVLSNRTRYNFSANDNFPVLSKHSFETMQYAKLHGKAIATFDVFHKHNFLHAVYQFYANVLSVFIQVEFNISFKFKMDKYSRIILYKSDLNEEILGVLKELSRRSLISLMNENYYFEIHIYDFYHLYIQQREKMILMLSDIFMHYFNINEFVDADILPLHIRFNIGSISRELNELFTCLSNKKLFHCCKIEGIFKISNIDYFMLEEIHRRFILLKEILGGDVFFVGKDFSAKQGLFCFCELPVDNKEHETTIDLNAYKLKYPVFSESMRVSVNKKSIVILCSYEDVMKKIEKIHEIKKHIHDLIGQYEFAVFLKSLKIRNGIIEITFTSVYNNSIRDDLRFEILKRQLKGVCGYFNKITLGESKDSDVTFELSISENLLTLKKENTVFNKIFRI